MAGRGATTFQKRQKEQQRKERQREKFEKRMERKRQPTADRPLGADEAADSDEKPEDRGTLGSEV